MSCDVFFYEAFAEEVPALTRHLPPEIKAGFTTGTIQEEPPARPPAALISIRTQSVVPPEWSGQLKGILARSTGYDHIVSYPRTADGMPGLGYLPKYCGRAVAEQAALMWLALLRKLPVQLAQFAAFRRDGITGTECEHKTLLVVGVGDIGYRVARIGFGLGMKVLGVDIVRRHADIDYVPLDKGLPVADVVVCAMNLTRDNAGYFRHDTLAGAKPGAIFVNVARGECSPAADLLRLLEKGILGGVGLDVFNEEKVIATALRQEQTPSSAEMRALMTLGQRHDVLLTPHNAFNTHEALDRKARFTVEQIAHFLAHDTFIWSIRPPRAIHRTEARNKTH